MSEQLAASQVLTERDIDLAQDNDFESVLANRSDHELVALKNGALRITHVKGEPTFLFLIIKMYLESLLEQARETLRTTITADNIGDHNRAKGRVEVISPLLTDGLGLVDLIDNEMHRRELKRNNE